MRVSSRAIVTSVAAFALAVGWIGATGASAGPAAEPSGARHIVVLHDDADSDAVARDHGRRYGAQVERVYHNALKGYVATFKGNGAADVARDPRVDFVELDQKVTVAGSQEIDSLAGPWGLDRLDGGTAGLDGTYSWADDGTGVTAYIIDTGIKTSHPEFASGSTSRASVGTDTVKTDGYNGEDCAGHGTHVAGTVGGNTYGVAKNVNLVSVRVLGCDGSGSWSGVIAGIDWVAADHKAKNTPAVANMSLGGGASSAVDNAVAKAITSGVTFAVAAGNGNMAGIGQDACRFSPARVTSAITVGATDRTDTKAGWSNFGKCVDWFAPGVNIVSASISAAGTEFMSGTSMATPHTAGVVAQYLSAHRTATPAQVQSALSAALASGVKSAGKGSPTKLLQTKDF
jgi:subtilisin family serine protease